MTALSRSEPELSPTLPGSDALPLVATTHIVEDGGEPREAAEAAGLRYVHADELGIVRRRSGGGFSYRDRAGQLIKSAETLERIRKLAIPPAWENVRIAERANSHLQATGEDRRGRRQYRYHPRFREVREAAKFEHLIAFAERLPALRACVARDMAQPGLGRERVLATVVRLLETTMIRIGGQEYAKANHSFGLASLRSRHARIEGEAIVFHFTGKSGKEWRVGVRDRRLARIVRACQELPGQALFQYVDEAGERQPISSADVNDYLKAAAGADITAKDFRTWWGTVLTALALSGGEPASEAEAKRRLKAVVAEVARQLGNTPAICLKCYVHPEVVGAHLAGRLQLPGPMPVLPEGGGLTHEEQSVLGFLRERAGKGAIAKSGSNGAESSALRGEGGV